MKLTLLGIFWINAMIFSIKGFSSPRTEISEKLPVCTVEGVARKGINFSYKSINLDKGTGQEKTLEEKIYVVIGVFSVKDNAIKFSQYAKNHGFPAKFSLNPTNNFYYVYLFSSNQIEEAKARYNKIIANTTLFPDIWVFNYRESALGPKLVVKETSSDAEIHQDGGLEEKIYVVAGVFALKSNAIKFSQYTENQGYPSHYALNPVNNFYYVYLYSSNQIEKVRKTYRHIAASTTLFPDLWVFNYKKKAFEKELKVIAQAEANKVNEKDDLVQMETGDINGNNGLVQAEADGVDENGDLLVSEANRTNEIDAMASAPLITAPDGEEAGDTGYFIYPNVIDIRSYKEIKATVEVIDPTRAKLIKTVDAHELSLIKDPNNSNHSIQLIAKAFGYRKVEHDLLLTNLDEDSLSAYVFVREDTILVEFPMVRLRKGDVVTMYNVFFHNDAAVMLSRSKYELNSLLEMLKENPDYKIRIHGHTNGNRRGKIIKLQKENPDFFTISEENKRGTCSARKLSEERAVTIKRYLVANGIAEDRMEVKGWGGRKMIYDKNSLDAKKNVRVEIEILED